MHVYTYMHTECSFTWQQRSMKLCNLEENGMELAVSYRELSEVNQAQKGRCRCVFSFEDSRLANVYMESRRVTVWKEVGEEPEGRSGVREGTEHACENDPSLSKTNK